MLINYFKMYFRSLRQYKVHNAINIFSLAFALVISLAIFSWVRFHTSFDTFHKDSDRIYRFVRKDNQSSRNILPAGYKNFVFNSIPEIENSVRIFDPKFLGTKAQIKINTQIFTSEELIYTDSEFFDIFSFEFISGNSKSAFNKPNSIVITEEIAKKYFGDQNPIGKILTLNSRQELEVTAVLKDIPKNSHFQFNLLTTLNNSRFGNQYKTMGFGSAWIFYNYVKLNGKISTPELEAKVKAQAKAIKDKYKYVQYENYIFQPLIDIHLQSSGQFELGKNMDIRYMYLFSFVGILILVIATINYINLTLAYSSEQTKNIGIQKVLGAKKKQIIQQYIFNSSVISFVSIFLAWIFWEIFAPMIATLSDNLINISLQFDMSYFIFILVLTIFLGVVTGFFPATMLSRFKPAQIIRGDLLLSAKSQKGTLRKALVIFQFIISTTLIIATIIIYKQMHYLSSKNLGYNKDQVVVLPIDYPEVKKNLDVFKKNIKSYPSILGVSSVSQLPCEIKSAEYVIYKEKDYVTYYITVDKDFFSTMNVEILKGKDQIELLDTRPVSDRDNFQNKFVINEQLLKELGLTKEKAINEQLIIKHGNMLPGPIIGIAKNFHFESLHNVIKPLIIEFDPDRYRFLLIHIYSNDIPKTIDLIKTQWQSISNGIPFEYSFFDKQYDQLYKTETQMGKIILILSVITILIAALGLLGLSLFSINKRTKEIGLRKVLGGSIQSILLLLCKELTKWVLLANIIAWPIAWFAMSRWLQNFAYKTTIEWWVFILAGGIALLIAVVTISIQSIKAALANPVESLKYE